LLVSAALLVAIPVAAGANTGRGRVVVADRASGTISVIDAATDQLFGTFALPAGDNDPEPMYVSYVRQGNRVFVGDRGNDRVVVFDAEDYSVVATIPTGQGVFHQWADRRGHRLWVNNDIDNTATVIDPVSLKVLGTVAMPADLIADGYKPHDVILGPNGRFAYVTLLGGAEHDWLVQFDTVTMSEVNRVEVGLDPHVSLHPRNSNIYVPAQNSDVVTVLDRTTLRLVAELDVPGAHGATMSPNGRIFYTTNLPGGGSDGLFAIDTRTNTVIGSSDTPYAVPHNVVVTNNRQLFLTHSGATSDKVTIYDVSMHNPVPTYRAEVTVGFNPFGIAYVP
jgi:YVTN family beta-propeller protein